MIVELDDLPEPSDAPSHRQPWSAEQDSLTHSRVVDCLGDHVCDVRIRHHGDHCELEFRLKCLSNYGRAVVSKGEVRRMDEWI